jgi:hypothetical protein
MNFWRIAMASLLAVSVGYVIAKWGDSRGTYGPEDLVDIFVMGFILYMAGLWG